MSYDLLIMQGLSNGRTVFSTVELSLGKSGLACEGVQKVLQSFMTQLLTEKGSVPSDPERGTDFLSAVTAGFVRNETLLKAQFGFAVSDIQRYLGATQSDLPEDEQFAGAELLSWSTTGDTLIIKVRVASAAGETVSYTASVDYL